MMYAYYSVDCTTEQTTVSEEWAVVLRDLDRLEYNNNRKASRHNTELSDANCIHAKNHISQPVPAELERRERDRNLRSAIAQLLSEQRRLIHQIYFLEVPVTEIARCEGVSKSAISHRLNRALMKMKKLLAA